MAGPRQGCGGASRAHILLIGSPVSEHFISARRAHMFGMDRNGLILSRPGRFMATVFAVELRALAALLFMALALTVVDPPALAQPGGEAGDFMISFADRAHKELNDPALDPTQRERRFRELFREAVDISTIARFILGPNWRRAKEDERREFLAVFEDIAVQRLMPVFTGQTNEFKSNDFEILGARPIANHEDLLLVQTRVARPQGPPVEVVWRIRKVGDAYLVLDVVVEGLSMALTLRDEYSSAVKRLGSVTALVKALREKLKKGAFAPEATNAAQ